jgi:two-component system chemotaxis response regulator CheB
MHKVTDRPIRVLAVDDSSVMRGVLRRLFQMQEQKLSSDLPSMELCGVAEDGVECLASVLRLRPDVIVLDLEMPRMHGLDVLERLRLDEPGLPVIMCSAYTERGARATLDALALGAADYVMKPGDQKDFASSMETLANQLLPKIAALAGAGFETISGVREETTRKEIEQSGRSSSEVQSGSSAITPKVEIVVIGISTGGPSALEEMLPKLPENFPVPVMIVQHMPKLFTGELAERLDRYCALRVREAYDGAEIRPGTIWIAPGDAHMEVAEAAKGVRRAVVRLHQQRALNNCKPSVDYLFSSAAAHYGAGTLALVMTGMGSDGLTGARHVHEAGGVVLTQNEATSAVWGMPGRVFQAGISREPLPLGALASELTLRAGAKRTGHEQLDPSSTTTIPPLQSSNLVYAAHPEVNHGLL